MVIEVDIEGGVEGGFEVYIEVGNDVDIEVDIEGLSMLLNSFFGSRDGFLLVATKSHARTEDNSFCLSFLS